MLDRYTMGPVCRKRTEFSNQQLAMSNVRSGSRDTSQPAASLFVEALMGSKAGGGAVLALVS